MSDIKLKAASGGGSISIKGPSTLGSDRDLVDTSGNINLLDSQKLVLGTGDDFEIFHDGSNTRMYNNTGSLFFRASDFYFQDHTGDENIAKFLDNGAIELYHDNTLQCSTSANGLTFPDGKGLNFGAVEGSGSDSTVFHDYEEGTWTPVDASGGSVSYTDTAGNCKYTKIGRTVIASFTVTFSSTSNTSQAKIGGLPYACVGTTNNNASVALGEHSDLHQITMLVNQGQSYMLVLACSSGVSVRQNNECSGKNYRGTAIYQTA